MRVRKQLKPAEPLDFFQTPFLITTKHNYFHHILVGNDEVQVRFAEQVLGLKCVEKASITDEDVLGQQERLLLRVEVARAIDLTPMVRGQVGIWSLAPLDKDTPGISVLVKVGAQILAVKPDRITSNEVARQISRDYIDDVRVAIWKAVWLLSGGESKKFQDWPNPWTQPLSWIPPDVDISYRLNSLYRDFVGYVFLKDNDKNAAKRFGISYRKMDKLEALSLNLDKVESSLVELSRWRGQKYDPYICALKISRIWSENAVLN